MKSMSDGETQDLVEPQAPTQGADQMAKKRKVYLREDMKHKVAREFRAAKPTERRAVAARYAVTSGSVYTWLRLGYGAEPEAKEPKVRAPKATAAGLEDVLMKAVRAALKSKAITPEEGAALLSLAV